MKRIFTAALAAALLAGAPAMAADWPAEQTVVSGADVVSAYAGADHFTGRVRMENLFPAAGDFQAYGARVTFEPGARTHWHIHPAGQVLIVTDGAGYTQEWGKPAVRLRPGDVVRCPPGGEALARRGTEDRHDAYRHFRDRERPRGVARTGGRQRLSERLMV